MKRSKPSTVFGGGEMNRDTSSVVRSAKSDAASDARSSLSTTCFPHNVGRPACQSLLVTSGVDWQAGLPTLCGERLEEHTPELQSQSNLRCRLLLEKKKQ